MNRIRLVLAVLVAWALWVAASASAATTLVATVGPGSTVVLKTGGGQVVKSLKAGSYTIVVRDRSKGLNFHLQGPTNELNRSTTLKFTGKTTWRLKLAKGKYQYYSDRGGSKLKRGFRVV